MSGTLVGTVGRLGPAGSLFLPMQSQGLSTWSLQQGSWTSHMAAQGSKINGSKRQEVKLPVSYTLGPEIGSVTSGISYQSRQSQSPPRIKGRGTDPTCPCKEWQMIYGHLQSVMEAFECHMLEEITCQREQCRPLISTVTCQILCQNS